LEPLYFFVSQVSAVSVGGIHRCSDILCRRPRGAGNCLLGTENPVLVETGIALEFLEALSAAEQVDTIPPPRAEFTNSRDLLPLFYLENRVVSGQDRSVEVWVVEKGLLFFRPGEQVGSSFVTQSPPGVSRDPSGLRIEPHGSFEADSAEPFESERRISGSRSSRELLVWRLR
jgi:hypothetical protein